MEIPKPSEEDKQFFRSLIPEDPEVELKPMFGNLGAFVHGNMFAGLFGSAVGVRLAARYAGCCAACIMLNTAPCGSAITAMRPTGVSNGGTRTEPPSSVVLATAASASATPKYTCQ